MAEDDAEKVLELFAGGQAHTVLDVSTPDAICQSTVDLLLCTKDLNL